MTEPTTASLTSILASVSITVTGLSTGDAATAIVGATAGAMWAVGAAKTGSRTEATWLWVKLVVTSLALAGFLVYLAESGFHVPASKVTAPIAFVLAAIGNRWPQVIDAVVDGVIKLVGASLAKVGKGLGLTSGDEK